MKKIVLLLAVLVMCLAVSAQAAGLLLPPSLKTIEEEAFMGDEFIEEIEFPVGLESIGPRAFKGCVNLYSLNLDAAPNLRTIGEEAFMGDEFTYRVMLPAGLETIGPRAFKDCPYLYDIEFETAPNLREIGEEAFMNDEELYNLSFCEGLECIGARAFYGWDGGTIELPASLREIGDEAFHPDYYDFYVILAEGTEAIDTLAFRDESLATITIPDTVTTIREDALLPSTMIHCVEGSAAEAYGLANGNPMEIKPMREMFSVSVDPETRIVSAKLRAIPGCALRIEVLDDMTGDLLDTILYPIEETLREQEVSVPVETQPEYYILRVTLEDENGGSVGDAVILSDCVRPYDPEIGPSGTPSAFKGHIISFGDKGFAALKEDVKVLEEGEALSEGILAHSEQTFEAGDTVYWPANNELFYVSGVTQNENGETIIYSSSAEPTLSDFYEYISYRGTFDVADPVARDESGAASAGVNINRSFEYGDFSASVSAGVSVTVDFRYNARPFTTDFIEFASWVTMDANIGLAFEKEYSFDRELPLIIHSIPTDAPGLVIDLDLTLPISVSAKARAEASAGFSGKLGFRYDGSSMSAIRDMTPSWDLSVEGEITGEIGPRASVGISFLRIVGANVGARPGIRLEAKTSIAEAHSGDEEPDERHACDLCFDVLVKQFIDLDGRLTTAGRTLGSKSFPLGNTTIFDGYLSVLNDEHSVHGGHIVLGEGKCPNYEYRVDVDVYDPEAEGEIKQVRIYQVIDRVERALMADGPAPLRTRLYPGDYIAVTTDFLGNPTETPFRVVESPESMILDFMLIPIDEEHFPDQGFRDYVAEKLDLDQDLILNAWERSRVKVLSVLTPNDCYNFEGVAYFRELEEFYDGHYCYPDVDLSRNEKITLVHLMTANHVNLAGCSRLWEFLNYNALVSIDLTGCTELQMLQCGFRDPTEALDLSTLTKLETISADNIVNPDFSNNPNLVHVGLWCCSADTLDLSNHKALESLFIPGAETAINHLDVSGCTSLQSVYCPGCGLKNIDLTGCGSLMVIHVEGNQLRTLDLTAYNYSDVCSIPPGGNFDIWDDFRYNPYLKVYFKDGSIYHDKDGKVSYCSYWES